MRCVVTGGAGFIGSNLALALQEQGHEVVVIDNLNSGSKENLAGFEGEFIKGDIRNFDWASPKPDIIFHQAAVTGVLDKEGRPVDEAVIMEVVLNASKKILDFCVKRDIPLIYASSSAVYGNAAPPFKEEDAGNPTSAYGKAKWEFDKIVVETKSEALVVGLRYTNVFGPREKYKGKLASMVWQLTQQMLRNERPRIFKYGEQKRDQVYIKDAIQGTLKAMKAKESCIVNIGSGKAVTFNHVVATLNKVLGKDLEPEYIDNPWKHYQEYTQADLTKARKIGYSPEWEFEDAVADYMKEEGIIS